MTCNVLRGYEIADEFRRQGKTVVLGGYHPSALPNEAKQHADSVVIGEAELTWPLVLDDFQKNARKFLYHELFNASLDLSKFLDVDPTLQGMVVLRDFKPENLLTSKSLEAIASGILAGEAFLLNT